MIELLSAFVGNGSTWGPMTYEPWLPFYQFVPIMIALSVAVTLVLGIFSELSKTRALLWGAVTGTSGFSAVFVVWLLWLKLDLSPGEVFWWWWINWVLIMMGQLYYIRTGERVKKQIKEMEDLDNAS